jgi:hypothetical protein
MKKIKKPKLINERNEKRLILRRVKRVSRLRARAFKAINEGDDDAFHFWNSLADRIERPKYILANDCHALDQLKSKVERLKSLNKFFKIVNVAWKRSGHFEGIRVTDYWHDEIKKNVSECGMPFTKNHFNRVRQVLFFTRKRIKALETARYFHPFEVNGIGVSMIDGMIQFKIDFELTPEQVKRMTKIPYVLKWSRVRQLWVRKFTGQGKEYFDQLKALLNEISSGN